jgi:hypothetical protein
MENYTEEQAKQVLKDFYDHIDGCFNDGKIRSFLDEKFKKPKKRKLTYKVGDRFEYSGGEYLLSQTGNSKVCLIFLRNGNRWKNSIKVKNAYCISLDEFKTITSGYFNDFIKL